MSIIKKMIQTDSVHRGQVKRLLAGLLFLGLSACSSIPENRTSLADLYDSSMDAYLKNDYLTAEQGLKMLSLRYPQDELVWFRLGNLYARTNRPDLAILAYEEALLRDASAAKPWHNKGMLQVYKAFYTFSDMLLEIGPDNPFYPRATEIQNTLSNIIEMEFLPIEHTNNECSGRKLWSEMHEHDENYKVLIPAEDQLEPSGCEDSAHFIKIDTGRENPVVKEIEAEVNAVQEPAVNSAAPETEEAELALKKQLELETAATKKLEMDEDITEELEKADDSQEMILEPQAGYDLEFEYGSDVINDKAEIVLNGVLANLAIIKKLKIQGVTGNQGSALNNVDLATRDFNKALAERRSNNVLAFLLEGGASASMMEVLPWDPAKEGFKVILSLER